MKTRSPRLLILVGLMVALCLSACKEHTHDFTAWRVLREATCEEEGREIRECEECGEPDRRPIDIKEHEFTDWELANSGSCTGEGIEERHCENCDETEERPVAAVTYDATQIHNMYVDSVGEVLTYDKQDNGVSLGTCFVYKNGTTLVTNYHVIDGAYSAEVVFGEDTYPVKKVLAYDKNIDVAVLQIADAELQPVTTCEKEHQVGQTVYAFGSSQGLTATFSDGMITHAAAREENGVSYVQHDAPISSGNSGGPLINAYGEVIGINVFTLLDSQNLNFAIQISQLEDLDYSDPLTMKAFYEKECDSFKLVSAYIQENGNYSDGDYTLFFGEDYLEDSDRAYTWGATYDPIDNKIQFFCFIDLDYYMVVYIDSELSGRYEWTYLDGSDNYMFGTVSASSFAPGSTLSCYDTNVYYSVRSSLVDLSTAMLNLLCTTMTTDLQAIGVTAADLGFVNY